MIKSRIETSAGLTELSGTELDLGCGGRDTTPCPPPQGGVIQRPLAPARWRRADPTPTRRRTSLTL